MIKNTQQTVNQNKCIVWHKVDWNDKKNTLPKRDGEYLCRIIGPANGGRFVEYYRTMRYGYDNTFACDSMIITHWAEDFNKPEDV